MGFTSEHWKFTNLRGKKGYLYPYKPKSFYRYSYIKFLNVSLKDIEADIIDPFYRRRALTKQFISSG